jgi:hypothetical protein
MITQQFKAELKEMSAEEKGKYVFLSRLKGDIIGWRAGKLTLKGPRWEWEEPTGVFSFERLFEAANEKGLEVIALDDPADDYILAGLVGHVFAMPLDKRGRNLLLLVGELEFTTPTAHWKYSVPGRWFKTDLTNSSATPIIQF